MGIEQPEPATRWAHGQKRTPEEQQALEAGARRLWDQGLSASEIGRRLGVTKNVIVGISRRKDFPLRGSPILDSMRRREQVEREAAARGEPVPPRGPTRAEKRARSLMLAEIRAAEQKASAERLRRNALELAAQAVKAEMVAPARAAAVPAGDGPSAAPAGRGAASSPDAGRASLNPTPGPVSRVQSSTAPPASMERGRRACCWPIGEPGVAGFRFCGEAIARPGKPYCAEHAAKAYARREVAA